MTPLGIIQDLVGEAQHVLGRDGLNGLKHRLQSFDPVIQQEALPQTGHHTAA